ncbi:hypothetical protein B0H13DRAFT_2661503 [Mycena leptocephala]|nr:hypothetical protein B0H13DRAFT_2661503 [Mycena leptocephala]
MFRCAQLLTTSLLQPVSAPQLSRVVHSRRPAGISISMYEAVVTETVLGAGICYSHIAFRPYSRGWFAERKWGKACKKKGNRDYAALRLLPGDTDAYFSQAPLAAHPPSLRTPWRLLGPPHARRLLPPSKSMHTSGVRLGGHPLREASRVDIQLGLILPWYSALHRGLLV